LAIVNVDKCFLGEDTNEETTAEKLENGELFGVPSNKLEVIVVALNCTEGVEYLAGEPCGVDAISDEA